MKKKARITSEDGEEDRISRLPDELIHKILRFVDTKLGVQTSVLSKRWKLVWTTLPFLKFKWNQPSSRSPTSTNNLTRHVLNHRNHQSHISSLEMAYLPSGLIDKFVEYAISLDVQDLNVKFRRDHKLFSLYNLSSKSIRNLELETKLKYSMSESDCWDLPALTTLRLTGDFLKEKLPQRCLTCLPALRTLWLDNWDLRCFSFSLPALTSLRLVSCQLPKKIWNFPALKSLTLTLDDVVFPENMSDIFAALVRLQNLTLYFYMMEIKACFIHCPELVNLEINIFHLYNNTFSNNIVVLAPKLSKFTSVGIFPITFQVSKLDSVNINLHGDIYVKNSSREKYKDYYQRLTVMLPGLGSAKILNLNMEAIEALSLISDCLVNFPSPFYNLKYVKLPKGCEEASISSTLRSYLLDGSPTATIVTTLPQNVMIPHTEVACVTAQNVVLQEPLASPTKVLVDSENIHKTVCVDTVDMGVQEEHMVQNFVLDLNRVRQSGAPVERTGNDQVSSSRGNSDFGLWRGHEVNTSPTKVLVDSENIHTTVCVDTVDMGVQEEHMMKNFVLDVNRVRQSGAPVERTGNDRVSSSRGNSDFGLWRGHEVDTEFVCLLDLIMNKYPETFEHFTTKNKKFCTVKLNLLCTSVTDFTRIPMTDVNTEIIAEYRDVFAELQKFGFNVSWLVSRLNYIEQVRFSQPLLSELHAIDCHIDDAKSMLQEFRIRIDNTKTKLQDLKTLRAEKMQEIQKAFGSMVTNLVVGYIGDGLFSGP